VRGVQSSRALSAIDYLGKGFMLSRLSGFGGPLIAVILVVFNIRGFYAGQYQSPNYTSSADNYRYILVAHTIRSLDKNNVVLSLKLGEQEYVYDLKANSVVVTAAAEPPSYVAPQRERTEEMRIVSRLPKTPASQVVSAKSTPSKAPACSYFCRWTLFGGIGYSLGFGDAKDYGSVEFQSAVHDTDFWKALATIATECLQGKSTAMRELLCMLRPFSRNPDVRF
jgi:hypothetical protein